MTNMSSLAADASMSITSNTYSGYNIVTIGPIVLGAVIILGLVGLLASWRELKERPFSQKLIERTAMGFVFYGAYALLTFTLYIFTEMSKVVGEGALTIDWLYYIQLAAGLTMLYIGGWWLERAEELDLFGFKKLNLKFSSEVVKAG